MSPHGRPSRRRIVPPNVPEDADVNAGPARVAVVGAGMAGAACASRIAGSGAEVHLFDKSRGVGGRLATRRVCWTDDAGVAHDTAFDHGAPGFSAQGAAFSRFVHDRCLRGELHRWRPRMASGSSAAPEGFEQWVAGAGMPALCRRLVDGLPSTLGKPVDALHRERQGWRLAAKGASPGPVFSQVVLAMPPRQAAELLAPHHPGWANQARQRRMAACWTLMAIADEPAGGTDWDVARPREGPLACIIRNDRKPGRPFERGRAHYVAHANAAWSETHLELPQAEVQAALLRALADVLPETPRWRFSQVHLWRYASVARASTRTLQPFWFDADLGLGVCGDYLGGAGVEGAWVSGDALAARIESVREAVHAPTVARQEDRSTT
jgi:renalase